MATLRAWEQRRTPALIHEAILSGTSARHACEAAQLSVDEAHVRWGVWATSSLTSPDAETRAELTVQQFLAVHSAFSAELEDR